MSLPITLFLSQILDDSEQFKALVVDSQKKFHRINLIGLQMAPGTERLNRFAALVNHIGEHVKVLHVLGMHLHLDVLAVLVTMTNLESIHLVDVITPPIHADFELNLSHLREVEIRAHDSFHTAMLFKNLPSGLLHKAKVLSMVANDNTSKPFANQSNIHSLVIDENSARHFHFETLKLESIEVIGPVNFNEILKNQESLKMLKAAVHAGDGEKIHSHARGLQELSLISVGNHPAEGDFKELSKLPNLVKLALIYFPSCELQYVNDSIGWATSSTLRELSIFSPHPLSQHALADIGRGFPRLEHLTISSHSSINGINVVLHNHPQLKFLSWKSHALPRQDRRPDLYFYQEGLQQKVLEELVVEQPIDAHKDLPILIHNLTSLKSFRHRSWDNVLQGVLEARPDVKITIA